MHPQIRIIFNSIGIVISLLFVCLNLYNFFESHSFKTAPFYTNTALNYAVLFLCIMFLGIWNYKCDKFDGFVMFILPMFLIIAQIFNN